MAISQGRSRRSSTGARYRSHRKKRDYETGRVPTMTRLAKRKSKILRTRGANTKMALLSEDTLNLMDSKKGKIIKAKIKNIVESPANRHFVRRNIITKGSVVETDKGKAKITSRPGQEGSLNGVLL